VNRGEGVMGDEFLISSLLGDELLKSNEFMICVEY
jgi:hypothetical protein